MKMKKIKLLSLTLLVVLVMSLVGCAGGKTPADVTDNIEIAPEYEKELLADWKNYSIVFAEGASDVVSKTFYNFTSVLAERYGSLPKINSDFLMPDEAVPQNTLEVLIGATNRPESAQGAEGLLANDYFIGMINNRLVIVGGSDKATAAAIDHYASYLLGEDGFMYPRESYVYNADYVVDKLTIGGVDISEFVLVRGNGMDADERNMFDYLSETIADVCGVKVETALASSDEHKYEILIGDTGRDITSKTLESGTYSIEQTATKLALYGNGESSDSFVLRYLIKDVLMEIPTGTSYDILLDGVTGEEFVSPSLVENNLPETFADLRGKYDSSVASPQATVDRFLLTVEELPKEVTVLAPIKLDDYLSASKKQVYVSNASGSDANDGSKNAPYKTIQKAVSAMANMNGGVIWVEGDTYQLSKQISLNSSHSGNILSPLFIKAYGDKEVTLTSNVMVDATKFKLVDTETDSVAARLHDDVEDKVYYINLFDLGWTSDDIVDVTKSGPSRLYADGEELILARFPNAYYEDGITPLAGEDYLYFTEVYEMGSVTATSNNTYWKWVHRVESDPNLTLDSVIGWEIRIPDTNGATVAEEAYMGEEIKTWVNTGDIWYYGNTYAGWEHGYYNIAAECVHGDNLLGYAKDDGCYSLKSAHPAPNGAQKSGNSATGRNTFYLFNAIEALDAPGEWFIDKTTGNLYIYPTSDDITKQQIAYSGANALNALLSIQGASYVVVDGIGVDGANVYGIRVNASENVVLQNITAKNAHNPCVYIGESRRCALIYSDLSHSYSTMLSVVNNGSDLTLTPSDVFIQNNVFHDTPPSISAAVSLGGCRTICSHNYFIDCCLNGGTGSECIVEYNRFEGGNRFITDGGMVYFGGLSTRGHHIRYNLFHMFKGTHQAVYFDTMGSGMYSYGNMISTLGAWTNAHKPWYSSTGHGNVCYANIMVLRNASQIDEVNGKDTDEQSEKMRKGDVVNESDLFYYYYGDGVTGNSEAGHWWKGLKKTEIDRRYARSDKNAWIARYPDYMNELNSSKIILAAYEMGDYLVHYTAQALSDKTFTFTNLNDGDAIYVPAYDYLDANGATQTMAARKVIAANGEGVTLSYDDISAMERLGRQPANSAIFNNIILGGSANPNNVITNNAADNKGFIKEVTYKADNFFEFEYEKIMVDADNYDYTITDEAWATIEAEIGADCTAILKGIDYNSAGLTPVK